MSQISHHFQVVRAQTLDYVLVALIGVAVAFVCARRLVHPDLGLEPPSQPSVRGATFLRLFIGFALGAVLGSGILQITNGILDSEPSRRFAAIVAARRCGGRYTSSLTLHPAPILPGEAASIDVVGCGNALVGDTVFLDLKPGFFGRPWIASHHIQTSEDRFRQRLEQRRRATP